MQAVKLISSKICVPRTNRPELPGAAGGMLLTQVRGYLRGFKRPFRNYKSVLKAKKEPKIDPRYFDKDFREPISGSAPYGDMAEERERDREFASDIESLTARGFLRFQKPYDPPRDAEERFLSLVRGLNQTFAQMTDKELKKVQLNDSKFKYDVLTKAASEFNHSVPNSMLTGLYTIGDAAKFYVTPITTTTPFEELIRMPDLPPNLHVQKEPFRFTEETIHLHGGVTAFPKESTIVTGLRAVKKYQGYKAKQRWP